MTTFVTRLSGAARAARSHFPYEVHRASARLIPESLNKSNQFLEWLEDHGMALSLFMFEEKS